MNRKVLLLAIPVAIAVPVAAFQLSQPKTASVTTSGKTSTLRLTDVTQPSLAQAIGKGTEYLRNNPGANFIIQLPAGRFDLAKGSNARMGSIDLSGIAACPGRLTIDGAGMDRTTLVRQDDMLGIFGRNTRCVTISDIGFTQNKIEVSQGTVVSADGGQVTLEIPRGFPTPDQLMPATREFSKEGTERIRRYLRKYVMAPSGPQIVEEQPQIAWRSAQRATGGTNRWSFSLGTRAGRRPDFRRGDLVGVKAKSGADAYRFIGGDRITFDSVRWALDSRGVFRGVDNITVRNCVIGRPPPIDGVPFLLATSAGGPQIGQPKTRMTSGHLIENNDFTATGDDGFMFARATGTLRNNKITDSFARGFLIVGSPNAVLQNNVLTRAPIERRVGRQFDAEGRVQPMQRGRRRAAANDNEPADDTMDY